MTRHLDASVSARTSAGEMLTIRPNIGTKGAASRCLPPSPITVRFG